MSPGKRLAGSQEGQLDSRDRPFSSKEPLSEFSIASSCDRLPKLILNSHQYINRISQVRHLTCSCMSRM